MSQWTREELAISVVPVVLSLGVHADRMIGRFVIYGAVDGSSWLGCRAREGLTGGAIRVVVRAVSRLVLIIGLVVLSHREDAIAGNREGVDKQNADGKHHHSHEDRHDLGHRILPQQHAAFRVVFQDRNRDSPPSE